MDYNNKQVEAKQHCWIRERGFSDNKLMIEGIAETGIYQ